MRKLLGLIVLALAVTGGWFLWSELQARRLADRIFGRSDEAAIASRTAEALKLTRASLQRIERPDLYASFSAEDLDSFIALSLDDKFNRSASGVKVANFGVDLDSGTMSISADFIAENLVPPGKAEGRIKIAVAPAFDGARLTLLPLGSALEIKRVNIGGTHDADFLRDVFQSLLKPVVALVAANVGRVEIPLQLAFAHYIELEESLGDIPIVESVSGSIIPLRLALDEIAALPTENSLDVVASGRFVSPAEYETARAALAEVRDQLVALRPEPCETCGVDLTDIRGTILCLERSLDCRAQVAFSDEANKERWLSSVELLALADAGASANPEERQLYADLEDLLAIRRGGDATRSWTRESVAELFQNVNREIKHHRASLGDQVETANETFVAFRRSFLGETLGSILESLTVSARLQLPDLAQRIEQTINTGPAPDLNCEGNARACPSVFEYSAWSPRGCDSDCGTRNCHQTFLGQVCVNGLDLGCQSRKYQCEATKERERLEYEARKAAVHAQWTLEKLACESLKAAELLGCDINQRWLIATQNSNLGRIEGEARFSDSFAGLSGLHATMAPDLSSLRLGGNLVGGTHVEASFVFTPLDAGHIACVAQWGDTVAADVEVVPADFTVEATLDERASANEAALVFRYSETVVPLRMSPPPAVALLTQAPSMALACPVPTALVGGAIGTTGVTGLAVAIDLALRDRIEAKVPAGEFRIPLAGSFFNVDGRTARAQIGSEAIMILWN